MLRQGDFPDNCLFLQLSTRPTAWYVDLSSLPILTAVHETNSMICWLVISAYSYSCPRDQQYDMLTCHLCLFLQLPTRPTVWYVHLSSLHILTAAHETNSMICWLVITAYSYSCPRDQQHDMLTCHLCLFLQLPTRPTVWYVDLSSLSCHATSRGSN